jgi:hypothetical protein
MAYRRGRRPFNKGKKCKRFKRVRMRGDGWVRRCASYRGAAPRTSRRRRRRSRRRPFNKGVRCKDWGVNKNGKRCCRSYGKSYAGLKNRRRSRPAGRTYAEQVAEQMAYRQRMMHNEEYASSNPQAPAWTVG